MNTLVKCAAFGLVSCLAVACGMDNMPTKMDRTNRGMDDMNGKMNQTNGGLDQMNEKMDQTNKAINHTNDQMTTTNASIDQTNGNMLKVLGEIRKTNDSMGDLVGKMEVTNDAIHNQILLLAKEDMMKPDSTLVLYPPTAMMPAGKKFAEEARVGEVLELTHAWVSDTEQAQLDVDELHNSGYTDAEIKRMQGDLQHRLNAELTALQVVGGFLPQATVDGVIKEVLENGRYKKAGEILLTFRCSFIEQVLLGDGVFKEGLSTYGNMLNALEYAGQMDYIGRLPFAKDLVYKRGNEELVRFNPKDDLLEVFGKIVTRFDADLDPMYRQPSTDPVVQKQSEDLARLKAEAAKNLAYWKAFAN